MSSLQTASEVPHAPQSSPPQPSPPSTTATPYAAFFNWRPTNLYQCGVDTYRVTIAFVARVWTPPPALDGVESASFILALSTGLFVMESYHAARYTLGQLRRFKTEAAFRHISILAGVPRVVQALASDNENAAAGGVEEGAEGGGGSKAKSKEGLCDEGDGDSVDAEALSQPPSWYQRALQRVSRLVSRSSVSAAPTLSDESDVDDAVAARPLQRGDAYGSEYDLLSRDVSVPFEMSHMLGQRGESSMLYGAGDAAAAAMAAGHDDGAGADEDEEEQTWEATPEMLMHYWKQMERTILNAPRRNARHFFRSLPPSMPFVEPDVSAINAWLDDVTHHLHSGTSAWSWFASGGATTGAEDAVLSPVSARPHGWRQRLSFAVPQSGCFAYTSRPAPEDFNPYTEEDSASDSEEDAGPAGAEVDSTAAAAAAVAPAATPRGDRCPRVHMLHWEALMLIWYNVVEVSMSSREIRALLLKASPPAFLAPAMVRNNGPTDFDLASANLSILWYWSTLQRVFETLVVNEDVEKCEADFEELQAYVMPLFFKCIARWPAPSQMYGALELSRGHSAGFICDVQAVWILLNAVQQRLLSLRRRLYYRNTWSLLRYMYSSSKAKLMSAALITVMMTISSRVSAASRVVRERIAGYVESGAAENGGVGKGGPAMNLQIMLGLCAFELTRMAVQYVITNTTSEFIVLTASQRREVVKMQLYEALSHTQLTFYEQHTYEEVEEILYYVNDMEGIDVQLHQYLFNAIHIFVELKDALQPFTYRSMAVAAAVAMAPYALRGVAALVERRYLLAQREGYLPSGAYAVEDEYQGDDDDANVLREGAMLRGEEIIAAIPQLRPYGADVRLVRWWNRHQQRRQHIKLSHHQRSNAAAGAEAGGGGAGSLRSSPRTARVPASAGRRSGSGAKGGKSGAASAKARQSFGEYFHELVGAWVTDEDIGLVRSAFVALVQLPHGKLLPGSGKALLDLSEWLLPMAASAYGVAWCGQPNLDPFQLVQGMQAIEAAVDSIGEARDTMEMVGYNAYKASMLERLLQPTQWEVVSREEEPFMANFIISASGVAHANDERQSGVEQRQLMQAKAAAAGRLSAVAPAQQLTVAPARVAAFYRRHVLRHIEVQNIRLRYVPVDPAEQRRQRRRRRQQQCTASGHGSARRTTSSLTRGGESGNATAAGAGAAVVAGTPSSATATPGSTSLLSGGGDGGFEGSGPLLRSDSIDRTTEDEDEEEESAVMDDVMDDRAPLFSADIILWSPPQQRGRFVCITAPNGGGKTALINLLLALYVNVNGPLPSSAASSPHAGRLGSGAVTFCFASRTHSRRQRRSGLTGRMYNASAASLARTGRSAYDSARPHGGGGGGTQRGRNAASPSSPAGAEGARMFGADANPVSYRPSSDRVVGMAEASRGEWRVDIRTIPADVLRRHIFSYVPELPTIFSGATVAQNISLAGYVSVATDALMRRVTQCAELAQCDFIQRLPLGLLTRISDTTANSWNTAGQYSNGAGNTSVTRLSADQAKRLMLARAYFHGGEVLLMDEPTKEIEDVSTAQRMCDGWRRLLERGYLGGVICVTMDPTLLNMADEVINLP